jgi:hypothetical protein
MSIIAHEQAVTCPAWCAGEHQITGDVHIALISLDADTEILLCRLEDGTLTADLIGEPSDIADAGTVRLTADAVTRLAVILAGL